jgi:phage terminase small subunit
MMETNNELIPMGKQILLPGIPERDPALPPSRGRNGQRITAKEKIFAIRYLNTRKIGQSAIEAGYSPKNAYSIGSRLLKKSQVAEFIREREIENLKELGMTHYNIVRDLVLVNTWDPRNLYREDGSLKDPHEWDDATAAVIAGIEVLEFYASEGKKKVNVGRTKKIKFVDRLKAREMMLRLMGLLKENGLDREGNSMAPGVTVQNRIEVVFVEAPAGDGAKNISHRVEVRELGNQEG